MKGQFLYHETCIPKSGVQLDEGPVNGLCVACGELGDYLLKAEIGTHVVLKVEDHRTVNLTSEPEVAEEVVEEEVPAPPAEEPELEIVAVETEPDLSEKEKQIAALKAQLQELEK